MIRITPRTAVIPSVPADTEMIAAKVGPRHGVHPRAKTPPSSGAPNQVDHFFGAIRVSRCRAGTIPMNARPMTMVITPPMRMRVSALSVSMLIAPKTVTVASTKTMVKPRMNNPAAPATAHWRLVTTVPPSAS